MQAKNIAIIGSAGAIGKAFANQLAQSYPSSTIYAFSRQIMGKSSETAANIVHGFIDYQNEESIAQAAALASQEQPLDLVIVTTGMLHDDTQRPEKSLKDLSADKLIKSFQANTVLPAIAAKHFIPTLNRQSPAIFAALSARVGSITDNQLGGWYAYRCSKAALNMMIKNAAIETARSNKQAIVIGLHPGTVDSDLSKPFQKNIKPAQLFSPQQSVQKMLDVLHTVDTASSGQCFAWDGQTIAP